MYMNPFGMLRSSAATAELRACFRVAQFRVFRFRSLSAYAVISDLWVLDRLLRIRCSSPQLREGKRLAGSIPWRANPYVSKKKAARMKAASLHPQKPGAFKDMFD